MESGDVLALSNFLERMRQPAASDLVKSIKSFIVSFSSRASDPDKDVVLVQNFFFNMESTFKDHPLCAGCSDEELESASEGLEKYVMTKLFSHSFAPLPDEMEVDEQLSEKVSLVRRFIRPENLDINPIFQDEASWLLAQRELEKIDMYKAPRDKLACILNCCRIINNLLSTSVNSDDNPPGADEFLPVLIYVTIRANPTRLHSNLLYIQRYRCQSRLVSEAAYFLTNMLSVESFIANMDAGSLSMDANEFEKNMEFARAHLLNGSHTTLSHQNTAYNFKLEQLQLQNDISSSERETNSNQFNRQGNGGAKSENWSSISDVENRGATTVLKERDQVMSIFKEFPFVYAETCNLTVRDVEALLNHYKQLVIKYVCLHAGLFGSIQSLDGSSPGCAAFSDNSEMWKEHGKVEKIEAPTDQSS